MDMVYFPTESIFCRVSIEIPLNECAASILPYLAGIFARDNRALLPDGVDHIQGKG